MLVKAGIIEEDKWKINPKTQSKTIITETQMERIIVEINPTKIEKI